MEMVFGSSRLKHLRNSWDDFQFEHLVNYAMLLDLIKNYCSECGRMWLDWESFERERDREKEDQICNMCYFILILSNSKLSWFFHTLVQDLSMLFLCCCAATTSNLKHLIISLICTTMKRTETHFKIWNFLIRSFIL